MPFTSSSLWPETAAGSSASTAATADTGGSGGPPLPSSWMGDSTTSGGWSQQVGSATGIDFDENLTSLEGQTSDGSYNAGDSRSRSQEDQVMMLDAAYMPLLSSSQFNFPSNYFSSWSGTAPRPVPVPSSSSNPSTTFAPTRMQNLPPLPSSQLPSSSTQPSPEAPLSRYAQLVQAKMRNTSLASASSSSSSGSSSNSLWNVPPPPKAPTSAPQTQLGIWSNPTPPGGPRIDQMGEQQLLDFQQGPNVCNSSFIGYNKEPTNFGLGSNSSWFGGLSGVAGEVQSDLAGERSTRGESSQIVDTSKQEEFRSRGVTASPASSSSQSSSRRGDKRKHPSGETQEEQQQEGLWGHPRPSHQPSPSSSFSSSVIPSDTPPFPNTSTSSSSASSLSQFPASNWFPSSSSSSSLLPSSYLPISTPTPTDYQATLNSYHTSSFQPGTGYAALPTPTVGRYPSASTEDAAWWTRINLTSNDPLPEVDASFVQSVFGPTTGESASSQSASGGNQQSSSGRSSAQDRYSYVASAHARQDPRSSASGSSGLGELSRYQQLMAAKYAASNPTPSNNATQSSTSLTPNFQTSTLTSTSSPSPSLNAHLATVSPAEYSQYPISSKYPISSSSALYSVDPVNYSQSPSFPSSSSQHQSFPVPQPSGSSRSTSSSFSSYFASSSTGMGGYQPTGAAAGGPESSGWAQKPYEDASTSRHSNRSQSWGSAEASSSSSLNSSLSTSMAPPYTNPLPLLHLPPTPTLSKPHRSPRPPVPAPPSIGSAAPPSTAKTQLQESLLLPTVLSGRPLVPILPRPPPAPTNFIATTTPSTSASLSPPSPLQPLLAMSSLPSPSFTSLPLLTPTNHSSSSSSSGASSSSMLPPPVPSSKLAVGPPPVPSFNSDEWESIAPLGGVPQRRGKPRAKKAKKEVSPEEESGEREEREGSASSTSGKGEDKKKKLLLACHFCRGRKLKCDGNRVQCANCVLRGTPCTYDTEIRRRGPGRKKIQLGGDGDEPYRDPNSTASKPTRMKGVGSGHGLKMSKVVKKEPAPEPAPIASSSHGSSSAEDEDGEGEEDEGEEEEGGIGELGVMGWTG